MAKDIIFEDLICPFACAKKKVSTTRIIAPHNLFSLFANYFHQKRVLSAFPFLKSSSFTEEV